MKYDFIEVTTSFGKKVISRNNIALIEPYLLGSKITLNIVDEDGKTIIIVSSDKPQTIRDCLSKS